MQNQGKFRVAGRSARTFAVRLRQAKRIALRLSVIAVLGGSALMIAPQAAEALPPDGPSPNTPGTYVEVWPTTVQAGDVLNFRVSGFPAGEIIYLKYDDGDASVCGSSAVHGACVIHTQAIPSSGVTVGSIVIPSDLPVGVHWIRFLASAPAPGGSGVLGYSLHGQGGGYGNSTFNVVAGGTGGQGTSASGSSPSGAAAPGQTTGEAGTADATTGAGATAKATVGDPATAEPQSDPKAPAATGAQLSEKAKGKVQAEVKGSNLTLAVNRDFANEWMYVFAYSTPSGLGWQQVANDGTLRFSILDLEAGDHRFAVVNADGELVGWTEASIDAGLLSDAQELATGVAAPADGAAGEGAAAGSQIPVVGIAAISAAVVAAALILWLMLRRPKAGAGGVAAAASAK